MNTLQGGITEFENGAADLPDAVASLLGPDAPALVFVRNIIRPEALELPIESRRQLQYAIGAQAIDGALAVAHAAWENVRHPSVMGFDFDTNNEASIGPHFDRKYLDFTADEPPPQVAVLGMALQYRGSEPSLWYGRRYDVEAAARLHLCYDQRITEGKSMPGAELATGDAVLFAQAGSPTMHEVSFAANTGRAASVWQMMAS